VQIESLGRALAEIENMAGEDISAYRDMMDSIGLDSAVRTFILKTVGGSRYPDIIFGMATVLLAQKQYGDQEYA
jgi:hypothetical protein